MKFLVLQVVKHSLKGEKWFRFRGLPISGYLIIGVGKIRYGCGISHNSDILLQWSAMDSAYLGR